MTKKNKFTVIKGGVDIKPDYIKNKMRFLESYVTDTRLMGVLGLYIAWEFDTDYGKDILHQFFYYDAEEYGLDTYEKVIGDNKEMIDAIEQNLIGGLGGNKIPTNEAEALYLLDSFIKNGQRLDAPLAEPKDEYLNLVNELPTLSDKDKDLLISKICTPLKSDYHLIHYYLMRTFALDEEGASYLLHGSKDPLKNNFKEPGTLCKNMIEEHVDKDGKLSYLCEALVDRDGIYEMVLLELTVSDLKITSAQVNSSFKVSPAEAVMMLSRSEYISVYEILSAPSDFDEAFLPEMASALKTFHDNGRLFMEFNKNNEHVNRKEFRLNEDIFGIFYVSDFGQLLIASYSLEKIHSLEKFLQKGPLSLLLMPTAKYEFKEPVIYDFIQSDFEDFEDYILSLK